MQYWCKNPNRANTSNQIRMEVEVNYILESIVFIVKGQILLLIHSSLSVLENRTAFCN